MPRISTWHLVVVASSLCVVFTWQTWLAFHSYWLESTRYSHGHLIVPISMYLLYQQKASLERSTPQPSFVALPLLAAVVFAWLVAVLGNIQAIQMIVMPFLIWCVCLAIFGWQLAKKMVLPAGYLYLAVPIWEAGNFILQYLTVKAVEFALLAARIPAFIEGNFVNLPAGSFEIAGGCSGLHYFIIAIAMSVLYAALYLKSTRRRMTLIVLAVFLAMLTNWVRVLIVVVAGHVTDMQHYLVSQDHYYFGWVLFVLAMIPFVVIARRLEFADSRASAERVGQDSESGQVERTPLVAVSAICLLLVVSASAISVFERPQVDRTTVDVELPHVGDAWELQSSLDVDWKPHYVAPLSEVSGSYRNGDQLVDVYMNVYRDQTQGRELIGFYNRIEGQSGWEIVSARDRNIAFDEEQTWAVRETIVRAASGESRLLYSWFEIDDNRTVGALKAKLLIGIEKLQGTPDAGVRIVSARCTHNCDYAEVVLQDWIMTYATHSDEPDRPENDNIILE